MWRASPKESISSNDCVDQGDTTKQPPHIDLGTKIAPKLGAVRIASYANENRCHARVRRAPCRWGPLDGSLGARIPWRGPFEIWRWDPLEWALRVGPLDDLRGPLDWVPYERALGWGSL